MNSAMLGSSASSGFTNGSQRSLSLPKNENSGVVSSESGPIGTACGLPYFTKKRFFAAGFVVSSFDLIASLSRKSKVFLL